MFAQEFGMFLQGSFQGEKQDPAIEELAIENFAGDHPFVHKNQTPGRIAKGSCVQELRIPFTPFGSGLVRIEREILEGRESPEFIGSSRDRFGLELLPGIGLQFGEPFSRRGPDPRRRYNSRNVYNGDQHTVYILRTSGIMPTDSSIS